jgi:hypothetical protein
LNLKNNYQKATQGLGVLRGELEGQRKLVLRQDTNAKAQQAQLQASRDETNGLRTLLTSTTSSLAALQGKLDTFSGTVTDKFVQIQPRLDSLTTSLHALSSNTSSFRSDTGTKLTRLAEASRRNTQTANDLRRELGQTDRQNMVAVRDIVAKLDTSLRAELDSRAEEAGQHEARALGALAALEKAVDRMGGRVEGNSKAITNLGTANTKASTNLDMIKKEIQESVSFLTGEMAKNVTETVVEIEATTSRVRRSNALLSAEVNKLRSHAQRSVDASSGVQVNVLRLEGELVAAWSTFNPLLHCVHPARLA